MTLDIFASIGILPRLAGVLFILIGIFLILVVLIQKGRGGGLASAFGGSGGQSVFGSKTGDMLTWVTIGVTVVFFLLAMYLSPNFKPNYDEGAGTPQLQNTQPIKEEAGNPSDSTGSSTETTSPSSENTTPPANETNNASTPAPAPTPANPAETGGNP